MGTNYYVEQNRCKTCNRKEEAIHLGKSSFGWRFAFQYNDGKYYKDIKEMKEWLKDKEIVDEYGQRISYKEFWKMISIKQKIKDNRSDDDRVKVVGKYRFYNYQFS
jgi:hypothetical protein